MHGCRQSMTKLQGMGGKTTVEPQLQTSLSSEKVSFVRGEMNGKNALVEVSSQARRAGAAMVLELAVVDAACARRPRQPQLIEPRKPSHAQFSFLPQTRSQRCSPSGSCASCSARLSCNVTALFFPFPLPAINASWYASGQHVLPH